MPAPNPQRRREPARGGSAASRINGTEANAAVAGRRGGETIEEAVLRNLEQYFAALGGAKPHALHEMVLQAVERPLLQFALQRAAGNQSAAAELLGINRNTLRKKLQDYRLV
jgi:Fis family transcriptional regulator